MDRVAGFAAALFLVQVVQGTPYYFSTGCTAFLILAALAFNVGGGLRRAAGAYVFFYSFLVVVVGLCYKALLGERADSNLQDPRTTIAVYVGGMAAMFVAVSISSQLSRRKGLLQEILKDSEMYRACIGCIVFGAFGAMLITVFDSSAGALNKIYTQLNQLMPLGIIIGVLYEIRSSGGKRSINIPVILTMIYYFFFLGLLSFSKQGMFIPFYCWVLPVCAMRFRLSHLQVINCLFGVFIVFQFLVPYSQYGRRFLVGTLTMSEKFDISKRLLSRPLDTREKYVETQNEGLGGAHYFNRAQGFWDRLNFIAVDDSLINVTDQGTEFGLSPIWGTFTNALPHFILPNKPSRNYGNIYAHEVGGLPDDDITTGISFSPTAEAYHLGRWSGIFIVAPLVWILLFFVLDSLLGDLRASPWGLLALALLSHTAPEGGVTGVISLVTYGVEVLIFCSFFATWLAPSIAVMVLGRDRRTARREISFAPAPTPRTQH